MKRTRTSRTWRQEQQKPVLTLATDEDEEVAKIYPNGKVWLYNGARLYGGDEMRTDNLRRLIASLQSILVLAEEHFGEDWGT